MTTTAGSAAAPTSPEEAPQGAPQGLAG